MQVALSEWEMACDRQNQGGLSSEKAHFTLAEGTLSFGLSLRTCTFVPTIPTVLSKKTTGTRTTG